MTKDEAVASIVSNVKTLRKVAVAKAPILEVFAEQYYSAACGITGYAVLPDALLPFVQNAVLQAWSKRGAEGLNSQTAAGISEQYLDVDYSLRQNLKGKRNPMAITVCDGGKDA